MVIKVQVKNVYGNEMVYPACPAAVSFARIAGTKTLSHYVLCEIEKMGFTIEIEAPRITRAR